MKEQAIIKAIKSCEEELAQLRQELEKMKEPWKPGKLEPFYCMSSDGDVAEYASPFAKCGILDSGNCFPHTEQGRQDCKALGEWFKQMVKAPPPFKYGERVQFLESDGKWWEIKWNNSITQQALWRGGCIRS